MWQQWRTAYPGAYSALETITDEPQNITSQVRQLILLEDPYRGSTDEQDRAYRDLDRITCEDTKNLWSFLEDFRQLATKSGKMEWLMADIEFKSINSLASKTPELRPGCLALNDSSIFLDKEGGSLAKSFSVVILSIIPVVGSNLVHQLSHDTGLLTELIALLVMLYFVVHLQLLQKQNMPLVLLLAITPNLDITSDHRPGSAGNTSITPDSVHAVARSAQSHTL
ncbi:hypothetical protein Tco_1313723 [Tanacetum coccineum]